MLDSGARVNIPLLRFRVQRVSAEKGTIQAEGPRNAALFFGFFIVRIDNEASDTVHNIEHYEVTISSGIADDIMAYVVPKPGIIFSQHVQHVQPKLLLRYLIKARPI